MAIAQYGCLGWAMPNYDQFADSTASGGTSYAVGSNLAGQTNAPYFRWNGLGTNATFQPAKPIISADNLSYPGLPASGGGSVAFTPSTTSAGGGGARLDLRYTAGASGTFYYSFLLKLTDLTEVPTYNTNNPIAAFSDDPAEQGSRLGRMGSRLLTKISGDGYVLGIGRNNTQGEYVYDTTVHNVGEVVFVVASYELVGGVTNVNLWVNPSASTFGTSTPPSPTVSATAFTSFTGNLNTQGPRAMAILCQVQGAPSGVLDELRVSKTWDGVTGGPEFSIQPNSQGVLAGTNVTFVAYAVGGTPLGYRWQKDGVDLVNGPKVSGANTASLTISNVAIEDQGSYTAIATNSLGLATSLAASLTVSEPVLDPRIVTQPVSSTNLVGSTATFHVVADGTPALMYQWQKNYNIVFDAGNISGANTDTLTVSDVSSTDQANYSVIVMNGLGTAVTSSVVTLTIVSPMTITAQPTSRTVVPGSKTSLAVGVSGTPPFTYRWQLAGAEIAGATGASYLISNVQASATGNYRVIVSGPINSDTSSVAVVSISDSSRLYPSNIAVIRIGDGAQTLTARGNSIFLDQFTKDGTCLSTVSIPDSGSTGMVAIGPNVVTLPGGGSSVSGSGLARSVNGQYLVIAGYNTNRSYTADLNTSSATAVPRGIGLVDAQGQYTLVVSITNVFGNTFWRGAVTDGTNNFWGWGRAPGTYYFGFDASATLVQGDWSNLRSMGIFNGSIYGVSAVSGKAGVMKLAGLATVSNAVEVVISSGTTSSSDCDISPDGNLLYLADDRASASGGGIQRWEFDGSTWTLAYTLTGGLPVGARYVTADFSGATPVVYVVTTEAENNQVVMIQDTGASATGTVIAFAGASQTFRGLRMGPSEPAVAVPPVLSVTSDAGRVILNWSGSYFLQSAPAVTGVYTDVINGTRPYTNSISSESQRFFRLRQ